MYIKKDKSVRKNLYFCTFQLLENEQRVHDLKVQLTTVQGHHKESMDQLGDKSRQVAALKTDLAKSQQQTQSLTDEVATLFIWLEIFLFKKVWWIRVTTCLFLLDSSNGRQTEIA